MAVKFTSVDEYIASFPPATQKALEELPGNRTKATIHSVFQSVSDRDGIVQSGMETGVSEGYERLDEILAEMK